MGPPNAEGPVDSIQQTGRTIARGIAASVLLMQFLRLFDLGLTRPEAGLFALGASVCAIAFAATVSFFFYAGSRVAYWLAVLLYGPGLLLKLALVDALGVGASLAIFDPALFATRAEFLIAEAAIAAAVTVVLFASQSLTDFLRFQRG